MTYVYRYMLIWIAAGIMGFLLACQIQVQIILNTPTALGKTVAIILSLVGLWLILPCFVLLGPVAFIFLRSFAVDERTAHK